MLAEISANLVGVCESIEEENSKNGYKEYCKNGKKFRQTSDGSFMRIQQAAKHLVVGQDFTQFEANLSICSSYQILKECGNVLEDQHELCLAIVLTAREIELNKWYEQDSKVCYLEDCRVDPRAVEEEATEYIGQLTKADWLKYVELGCSLLAAAKINFYQTDHHVMWPRMEGRVMTQLLDHVCGPDSLEDRDIYEAIRAFSHWASIRGILYKLGLQGVRIEPELKVRFRRWPKLADWISRDVNEKYPAGASKFGAVKSGIEAVAKARVGNRVQLPPGTDLQRLWDVCSEIDANPVRFHIRAARLHLSVQPAKSASQMYDLGPLIEFLSCVHHLAHVEMDTGKLLKLGRVKQTAEYKEVQRQLQQKQQQTTGTSLREVVNSIGH